MLLCLEISQSGTPAWWLLHAESCQWLHSWYYFCLLSQSGYSSYLWWFLKVSDLVMFYYLLLLSIFYLLAVPLLLLATCIHSLETKSMEVVHDCVEQKRILIPWPSGHKRQWICLLITIQNEHLTFGKKISKLPPGVQTHHMLGAHGVGPGVDTNSISIWYIREL